MSRGVAAIVVAAATLGPMAAAYGVGAAGADDAATPLGPGLVTVEVETRYSRYSFEDLQVYEGTLVRFVVTNRDLIHHELIVGDDEVVVGQFD